MGFRMTVFSQIMEMAPKYEFRKCVARYDGDHRIKTFSCWNQFLCLAFAQLTHRLSLRDIVATLNAMEGRLYHMGFRGSIARSTLAEANESRSWRIVKVKEFFLRLGKEFFLPCGKEVFQSLGKEFFLG